MGPAGRDGALGGLPATSAETLIVGVALFWALTVNRPFLDTALAGRDAADLSTWGFALALGVMLVAVHTLLLGALAIGRATRPVLVLLLLVSAVAAHFMQSLGVVLDPSMVRNVLHTDPAEASELLSASLWRDLALYGVLPALAVAVWPLRPRGWAGGLLRRAGLLLLVLLVFAGALMATFQPMASLMRNQKALRYQITPANVAWSLGSVLAADARGAAKPRQPIGLDAKPGPRMAARTRPLVVVLVVGETARADHWGLNGSGARDTTPRLAQSGVLNFPDVSSCGTNTEVSLPCMFAPVGRRDYDEARIRGQESLLHVAARAGVGVQWRDNQSGCKGVCEGLPVETVAEVNPPGLCSDGRCLDEGLLWGLDERLARARGTQVWVLHQLGNHGPSYFRRHPAGSGPFQPECRQDDLRLCRIEEIRNAYDNALRYTDQVLADLVARLAAASDRVDSVMLYASDHGESLGENGLFLHGVPRAFAPAEQTRVPMVMWWSDGARQALGLDAACLARRAQQPAAHDHLFHTLLGVLDVRTALYEPAFDLTAACRGDPP